MKKVYAILTLVVLACATVSFAQSQQSVRILSLEECIERAVSQSTTVGQSTESLMSARQNILRNYGRFLPDATATFYAGRNFVGPTVQVGEGVSVRRQDQVRVLEVVHAPQRLEERGERIGLPTHPADVRGDRRQDVVT